MCKELEDESKMGRTRNIYQKLKEIMDTFNLELGH